MYVSLFSNKALLLKSALKDSMANFRTITRPCHGYFFALLFKLLLAKLSIRQSTIKGCCSAYCLMILISWLLLCSQNVRIAGDGGRRATGRSLQWHWRAGACMPA